jgi:hypothetical protein
MGAVAPKKKLILFIFYTIDLSASALQSITHDIHNSKESETKLY